MVIQIRIVIRVPKGSEADYPEKIERITDAILREFPDAQRAFSHSPIIVTIDRYDEIADKVVS